MNDSGVPAAIAIACAATFIRPASTNRTSTTYVKPNATSDTVKKRIAWRTGWSCLAPNVQCRLSQKLFRTYTTHAITADRW